MHSTAQCLVSSKTQTSFGGAGKDKPSLTAAMSMDVTVTAGLDFDDAFISGAAVDVVRFLSSPSLDEEESVSHSCANGLSAIIGTALH